MRDHHKTIAQIMGHATRNVLWASNQDWILQKVPGARLATRVGPGKKTYCKYDQKNCFTLTYGKKMVESKFDPRFACRWLSTKEIQQRKYYGGDPTLLNILSHTICHEYVHIIQNIKRWRYDGSVHNPQFYYLLDRLHKSDLSQKVRNYLSEQCHRAEIELAFSASYDVPEMEPAHNFRVGEMVRFNTREGRLVTGQIKRVNKKTLTIKPAGSRGRSYWRVSPMLVTKAR